MSPLRIISATRRTRIAFYRHAELGLALRKLSYDTDIRHAILFQNDGPAAKGLPEIYNAVARRAAEDEMLLFVHDDVYLDDFFLRHRLHDALAQYDVVGVAGSDVLDERHQSWRFWRAPGDETVHVYDESHLSGAVAHFHPSGDHVSAFGPTPRACELLDGCFLAVRAATLQRHAAFFDPAFRFHFYDLDFCRTCRAKGLHVGTWPIAVTHVSGGAFDAPPWEAALAHYRQKWSGPGP